MVQTRSGFDTSLDKVAIYDKLSDLIGDRDALDYVLDYDDIPEIPIKILEAAYQLTRLNRRNITFREIFERKFKEFGESSESVRMSPSYQHIARQISNKNY